MAENAQLRAALRQAQQDVEILQEALGFLPRAGKSSKAREVLLD